MLILGTNSVKAAGGYNVANSCMFNTATESKMAITFGSAGTSLRKATFSSWLKRSNLTVDEELIFRVTADSGYFNIAFSDADTIKIKQSISSTVNLEFISTQKFRDPSAWLHMLVVFDTTQSTEANRVKIYINGTQVTSWSTSTYPDQNTDMLFGAANVNTIASSGGGNYFGGYLAEMCYCDGQSLTPTSFGEFDEDSGIWKPIDVSGLTFGTNGFYLDFEDSANLGNDANGGTDLTETNLAATNQGIDTCTNNFATLNPLVQGTSDNARTFSDGNTTVVLGRDSASVSSIGVSSGKWYVEIKCVTDAANPVIGIAEEGSPATVNPYGGSNLVGVKEYGYVMAYDADTGTLWFAKNGAWQASATKTEIENGTTTNSAFTGLSGLFFFGCCDAATPTGDKFSCNFGSPYFAISSGNADGDGFGNFEYEVPSGYFALCSKNLAEYG